MPLRLGSRSAVLSGDIVVEDAEPLTAWLRATGSPRVNLRACTSLHTSALQALLAAGAVVSSKPTDEFLAAWVLPLLGQHDAATPPDDQAGSAGVTQEEEDR